MDKNTNAADNKVAPEIDVDKIIEQLLSVRDLPGKQVKYDEIHVIIKINKFVQVS